MKRVSGAVAALLGWAFLLLPACAPGTGGEQAASQPNLGLDAGQSRVRIERVSHDVRNDQGTVLGICYFDKLTVEQVPAADVINAYFDGECNAFFRGSGQSRHFTTDQYGYFQDCVENMADWFGEETLALYPLENTVSAEVAYEDEGIISVKECWYWMAGGVADTSYFGETIDVTTGTFLTVDCFVSCDIQAFNEQVITLLTDFYAAEGGPAPANGVRELVENRTFEDYEYYFDGVDVWLLFGQNQYYNDGHMIPYPAA